jgi:plasmid stability protein
MSELYREPFCNHNESATNEGLSMPAITVKNIPDRLYEYLKASAHIHRRSINSELIVCLERVLLPTKIPPHELITTARALRDQLHVPFLTVEEINRAKAEGRE